MIAGVVVNLSAFTPPPDAAASPTEVKTHIEWSGPDEWIEFNGPSIADRTRIVKGKVYGQGHVDLVQPAFAGDYFGADPIIGNSSYVSCSVTVDGREVLRDSAYKNDGHDCNCLRRMT